MGGIIPQVFEGVFLYKKGHFFMYLRLSYFHSIMFYLYFYQTCRFGGLRISRA